jgi:hypothetical protein
MICFVRISSKLVIFCDIKSAKFLGMISILCVFFHIHNDRGDPLRWPRDTLYPQKLALTSPTSGGHSVGIVCLRTKGHGVLAFRLKILHWGLKIFSWVLLEDTDLITDQCFFEDVGYPVVLQKGLREFHFSFIAHCWDFSVQFLIRFHSSSVKITSTVPFSCSVYLLSASFCNSFHIQIFRHVWHSPIYLETD